jgi:hypothetical protein
VARGIAGIDVNVRSAAAELFEVIGFLRFEVDVIIAIERR